MLVLAWWYVVYIHIMFLNYNCYQIPHLKSETHNAKFLEIYSPVLYILLKA